MCTIVVIYWRKGNLSKFILGRNFILLEFIPKGVMEKIRKMCLNSFSSVRRIKVEFLLQSGKPFLIQKK
jgi:hypothetical protein